MILLGDEDEMPHGEPVPLWLTIACSVGLFGVAMVAVHAISQITVSVAGGS